MAQQELECISDLLDRATVTQGAQGVNRVVEVVELTRGVELVYGVFPYQTRAIGVQGRRLTAKLTRQPTFAVREGAIITPIPYAEDVQQLKEPLVQLVVDRLKVIGARNGA